MRRSVIQSDINIKKIRKKKLIVLWEKTHNSSAALMSENCEKL